MRTIPLPLSKRYEPIGHCIYCGRHPPDVTLSVEHIIPLGIDGSLVLPDASCNFCAATINRDFENHFLQEAVIDARAHLNMRSRSRRRNKKPPPSDRPSRVGRFNQLGAFTSWEYIQRDRYPFAFLGLILEPPTILTNEVPKDGIMVHKIGIYISKDFHERFRKLPSDRGIVQMFSPDKFCRQIAKIAHGAAIAELGNVFDPFLPPIILGQASEIFHYVGGSINRDDSTAETHTLSLMQIDKMLIANVRLFSNFGAPTYLAVVGQLK